MSLNPSYESSQDVTVLLQPQPPVGEEARVDNILQAVQNQLGLVPDGLRLYGISPPLLETFVNNVSYFIGGGSQLRQELLATIRYLVSWHGSCNFCVDLNEGLLVQMGYDLDTIRAMRTNPEQAPLEEKEKSLLKIALMAVSEPENINQEMINSAKQQGWTDRNIFDVVVQAANNRAFNMVLRSFKIEQQGVFANSRVN
jgi:alkylhydroperoxidase family enzyme